MKRSLKLIITTIIVAFILNANIMLCFGTIIGNYAVPYAGDGSESNPNTYLASASSKLTWKHLNDVKSKGVFEKYEIRENDNQSGKLKYSWFFSYKDITVPEGPYFLGINFYSGDIVKGLPGNSDCMYFSFAHKRDLPGKSTITMDVSSFFTDGTKLYLYYYGGYNSTIIHDDSPIILPDEIRSVDKMKLISSAVGVKNGYAQYDITYGGNYFLSKEEIKIPSSPKPDTSSPATTGPVTGQNSPATSQNNEKNSSQSPSGVAQSQQNLPAVQAEIKNQPAAELITEPKKISDIFSNQSIANAVASYLGKNPEDTITQNEISGIKKLYLSKLKLDNISDLEKLNFERLESLIISDNNLTDIGSLTMPMLNYLDVSGNKLHAMSSIITLKSLENINLSNNTISEIPDFSTLLSLSTLNLSGNQMTSFPKIKSKSIRYIDLSNNQLISAIDFSDCPSLESISISGQQRNIRDKLTADNTYKLNPIPELITQFCNDVGTVRIYDKSGNLLDELSFEKLKEADYTVNFSKYKGSSEYKIVVTGYKGEKSDGDYSKADVIGTYTFTLENSNYHIQLWIIPIILVIAAVIFIIYRLKVGSKKAHKEEPSVQ